jgi:hypothetical protein
MNWFFFQGGSLFSINFELAEIKTNISMEWLSFQVQKFKLKSSGSFAVKIKIFSKKWAFWA